jgi:hypothetical protein
MIMEEEVKKLKRYPTPKTRVRLGDRVEAAAKPIAQFLDVILGTHIEGCLPCQKRRDWLNELDDKIHKED